MFEDFLDPGDEVRDKKKVKKKTKVIPKPKPVIKKKKQISVDSGRLTAPFRRGRIQQWEAPFEGDIENILISWDALDKPKLHYQVSGRNEKNHKYSYFVSSSDETIHLMKGESFTLLDVGVSLIRCISIQFTFTEN